MLLCLLLLTCASAAAGLRNPRLVPGAESPRARRRDRGLGDGRARASAAARAALLGISLAELAALRALYSR
jgi:hypothetical protein